MADDNFDRNVRIEELAIMSRYGTKAVFTAEQWGETSETTRNYHHEKMRDLTAKNCRSWLSSHKSLYDGPAAELCKQANEKFGELWNVAYVANALVETINKKMTERKRNITWAAENGMLAFLDHDAQAAETEAEAERANAAAAAAARADEDAAASQALVAANREYLAANDADQFFVEVGIGEEELNELVNQGSKRSREEADLDDDDDSNPVLPV